MSPEMGMIRTYLDWLVGLPWQTATVDNLDIKSAARSWKRITTACPR